MFCRGSLGVAVFRIEAGQGADDPETQEFLVDLLSAAGFPAYGAPVIGRGGATLGDLAQLLDPSLSLELLAGGLAGYTINEIGQAFKKKKYERSARENWLLKKPLYVQVSTWGEGELPEGRKRIFLTDLIGALPGMVEKMKEFRPLSRFDFELRGENRYETTSDLRISDLDVTDGNLRAVLKQEEKINLNSAAGECLHLVASRDQEGAHFVRYSINAYPLAG